MTDTWKVFQGKDGQWYFHRVAANGEVVASSEGYHNKSDATDEATRQAGGTSPKVEE